MESDAHFAVAAHVLLRLRKSILHVKDDYAVHVESGYQKIYF